MNIFQILTDFFGSDNFQFGIKKEPNAVNRGWLIPASRLEANDDTRPAVESDLILLEQRQELKNSIVVRPLDASRFILFDDCDIKKHMGKPGRLIVETSPNNFQVWVKTDREVTNTEKSFWIAKLGADKNCFPEGRWGKCPGYFNYKTKHLDNPPLVNIKFFCCTSVVLPFPDVKEYNNYLKSLMPKEIKYVKIDTRITKSKSRQDFFNGDESSTDLKYALYLLRCGCELSDIKALIMNERQNWVNKKGMEHRYVDTVVNKAVSIFH